MRAASMPRPPFRFWGRKAGEALAAVDRVVLGSISRGSLILDPFLGSGSIARHLLGLGYRVVASDVNYYAWLATRVALGRVELPGRRLPAILQHLRLPVALGSGSKWPRWLDVLSVRCNGSRRPLAARLCDSTRGECRLEAQGCSVEAPLDDMGVEEVLWAPRDLKLRYPWGEPFDKKRGVESVSQLYSRPMLAAMSGLALLLRRLGYSQRGPKGSLLWLALASLAYSSSRMQKPGGGTWPVNSYWLPRVWRERNPLLLYWRRVAALHRYSLKARLCTSPRSVRGLRGGRFDACALRAPAQGLAGILPRGFFDALVTDPPHYDEVQYYELSLLHIYWLQAGMGEHELRDALEAYGYEVVVNPRRGVGEREYLEMLGEAFSSVAYTLKPGAPSLILLHEEDTARLKLMVDSIASAGYRVLGEAEIRGPVKPVGDIGSPEEQAKSLLVVARRELAL